MLLFRDEHSSMYSCIYFIRIKFMERNNGAQDQIEYAEKRDVG